MYKDLHTPVSRWNSFLTIFPSFDALYTSAKKKERSSQHKMKASMIEQIQNLGVMYLPSPDTNRRTMGAY